MGIMEYINLLNPALEEFKKLIFPAMVFAFIVALKKYNGIKEQLIGDGNGSSLQHRLDHIDKGIKSIKKRVKIVEARQLASDERQNGLEVKLADELLKRAGEIKTDAIVIPVIPNTNTPNS